MHQNYDTPTQCQSYQDYVWRSWYIISGHISRKNLINLLATKLRQNSPRATWTPFYTWNPLMIAGLESLARRNTMHQFPGRAKFLSAELQGQSLLRKNSGFFSSCKKFIYCFPILLLSVSTECRERPTNLPSTWVHIITITILLFLSFTNSNQILGSYYAYLYSVLYEKGKLHLQSAN